MKLAYLAFLTVCIVWGTTYLGIAVALESIPVLLVAGLRWMFAGVVMSALMLATGRGLPPLRLWGPLALLGFLMNVVGNGFVVYAQQYVASGLTAVLIATTPFWTATIERFLPNGERFSARALLGLSLGFSGIVVLVWPEMTNGGDAMTGVTGAEFAETVDGQASEQPEPEPAVLAVVDQPPRPDTGDLTEVLPVDNDAETSPRGRRSGERARRGRGRPAREPVGDRPPARSSRWNNPKIEIPAVG